MITKKKQISVSQILKDINRLGPNKYSQLINALEVNQTKEAKHKRDLWDKLYDAVAEIAGDDNQELLPDPKLKAIGEKTASMMGFLNY